MGSTSSRPKTFEQYYKTVDEHGLSEASVDPYDVLDVSKNFTWEELVTAYRRLARLVHPDKGPPGEKEVRTKMFQAATKCFRDLAQEYKMRGEGRNHSDLKGEAMAYYSRQAEMGGARRGGGFGGAGRGGEYAQEDGSFLDRFNKAFENNRLEDDENDMGYGHQMAPSSKVREDIHVPQTVKQFTKKSFNDAFEKHTIPHRREMVVYKEPEALPLAKKMAYTELGGERPDDFSSTREGTKQGKLDYVDYMRAHTTTRLIDPRSVKERKNYSSVDAYEADRARTMAKPPTKEELEYRKQRENEDKQMEAMRVARLKQRDALAHEHHERMNRMMLGGR
jgi:curved DNA-binding protein CbpA